ncbi:MAG TPA: succinyldiaminopimelate transaminase [Burkholderiales bacterium]|jgi:N-succinyldiaminopimelate aminotransferase|nr:succinyldiaminopimelate transaminase [Burkholderiales bacterium]
MNPDLAKLQSYPFEKLRALYASVAPNPAYTPISLSIGEPKHATPEFIRRALAESLAGLAAYPATTGSDGLRMAIADWLKRRYGLLSIDPHTQILPVNGSREALFAIAQTIIDRSQDGIVICPNPFYQIYEGAALLAGAQPFYLNATGNHDFIIDYDAVPKEVWSRVQLLYCCSPGNPTGKVMALQEWKHLFELSDRHDFVIVSDECYSELYFDEAQPPLGGLEAAQKLGRKDYRNLITFSSLSKRSNVPGMRSGFVAGDARLMKAFLLYRTYHGSAMSPAFQAASEAAWRDEAHVVENRRLYREKFLAAIEILRSPLQVEIPQGGFYFWLKTPIEDTRFARELYAAYNVAVLPGSYLAREAQGLNPGAGYVRVALVAPFDECLEGIHRLNDYAQSL